MVKLSKKIIEMFNNEYCDKNKPLIWVATTDNEGNPHLAPICFSKVINKNKILISINFAKNIGKYREWFKSGCSFSNLL